jgi:AraC family transcriptional regulator
MVNEQVVGLPAWRLKRAPAFVDLNLDGRLSTGLRPHEYVLRKRVERTKTLMVDSNDSIVAIARASGFSTGEIQA